MFSSTLSAVAVGMSSGTARRATSGTMALVLSDEYEPTIALTLSWSTSLATPWAAMSALLWSSYFTISSGLPSTPPEALISSSAMS